MRLSNKKWNQGKLDENSFAMQRERASHQVPIDTPVARLFALACQAGQPGWLPAGSVRLLGSDSGKDEIDAVWSDSETGAALLQQPALVSFWTTTLIDAEAHRYQAVLAQPELAVGTLDVEMVPAGNRTVVRFSLSYTALSEAGSALFGEGVKQRLEELLKVFGETLASLAATGEVLAVATDSRRATRRTIEHAADITGDIDECFTLACPVAELLWIDGWQFDLVYSQCGVNETGCVFLEPFTGLSILRRPGANNYWYVTCFDREAHLFEAVWMTQDLTIARWQVTMTEIGGGQVRVRWRLRYTGLGPEGSSILAERGFDGRMKQALQFLTISLKTYVETGVLYQVPGSRKLQLAAALIGAALGRHYRRVRGGSPSASATAC